MIALLWLMGCGPAEEELTVLAASSLTEVFGELEPIFEEAHPGVDVRLVFAGSQTLATQIRHGVRADVFASADRAAIEGLGVDPRFRDGPPAPLHEAAAEPGLLGAVSAFATNELVIAVPADREDPLSLGELGSVERLVLGGEAVPVGRYTEELLDAAEERYGAEWRASVDRAVVSREPSVRSTLAKVTLGEADAAIVYATDVAAVSGVRALPLPDGLGPEVVLFQAPILGGKQELAEAWIASVRGPRGRAALIAHGFSVGS